MTKSHLTRFAPSVALENTPSGNALLFRKKCVNCDGAHSTLSYKCPSRKAAETNKVGSTQGRSYAAATAGNYAQPPVCNNTSDQLIRANMSITIACMHESTNTGCFQEVLNKLLKNNNLPT